MSLEMKVHVFVVQVVIFVSEETKGANLRVALMGDNYSVYRADFSPFVMETALSLKENEDGSLFCIGRDGRF